MSSDHNEGFSVIPAPAGTKGIFETDHEHLGDSLTIDDVAFLNVWHDGISDGSAASRKPAAYSVSGQRAQAIFLSGGRIVSDGALYLDVKEFMKACGKICDAPLRHKPLVNAATGEQVPWDA